MTNVMKLGSFIKKKEDRCFKRVRDFAEKAEVF
jgi:hypothetical protein